MKKWVRHKSAENEHQAVSTLGSREIELLPGSVISVTRGENFQFLQLMLNECLNRMMMKKMEKTDDLLYAALSGPLPGGVSQTVTIWKSGRKMNQFRQDGLHEFFRKVFKWVFFSGNVQAYFLTWKVEGTIPPPEEITSFVKKYGRHFDHGVLVRKGSIPVKQKQN